MTTQQPIPNYNTKIEFECDFGKNSDFESYQYYWNGTVCPKQSTLSEHQKLILKMNRSKNTPELAVKILNRLEQILYRVGKLPESAYELWKLNLIYLIENCVVESSENVGYVRYRTDPNDSTKITILNY
jgi:hypothetical protein